MKQAIAKRRNHSNPTERTTAQRIFQLLMPRKTEWSTLRVAIWIAVGSTLLTALWWTALRLPDLAFKFVEATYPKFFLPEPAREEKYAIVITQLLNDENRTHTEAIASSITQTFGLLQGEQSIQLLTTGFPINGQIGDGDIEVQINLVEERAQHWLDQLNADVLIWGEVVKESEIVRLHLVPRLLLSGNSPRNVKLTSSMDLPIEYLDQIEILIADSITTIGNGCFCNINDENAAIIAKIRTKLDALIKSPPANFDETAQVKVAASLAQVDMAIGIHNRDTEKLREGLDRLRQSIDGSANDLLPRSSIALLKYSFGYGLLAYGDDAGSPIHLLEAVHVLEKIPVNDLPTANLRAGKHINAGAALLILFKLSSNTNYLQEAITTLSDTPDERNLANDPSWGFLAARALTGNVLLEKALYNESMEELQDAILQLAKLEHTFGEMNNPDDGNLSSVANYWSSLGSAYLMKVIWQSNASEDPDLTELDNSISSYAKALNLSTSTDREFLVSLSESQLFAAGLKLQFDKSNVSITQALELYNQGVNRIEQDNLHCSAAGFLGKASLLLPYTKTDSNQGMLSSLQNGVDKLSKLALLESSASLECVVAGFAYVEFVSGLSQLSEASNHLEATELRLQRLIMVSSAQEDEDLFSNLNFSLGNTMKARFDKVGSVELLSGAQAAYSTALEFRSREDQPDSWATIMWENANVMTKLAQHTLNSAWLTKATIDLGETRKTVIEHDLQPGTELIDAELHRMQYLFRGMTN